MSATQWVWPTRQLADSAADQSTAQLGDTTSGTPVAANTGSAGLATIHPGASGSATGQNLYGPVHRADGTIRPRMFADDPSGTNRASPGQVTSGAVSSGASQAAGSAADPTSGSHSPSNTQAKGTTDPTANFAIPGVVESLSRVSRQRHRQRPRKGSPARFLRARLARRYRARPELSLRPRRVRPPRVRSTPRGSAPVAAGTSAPATSPSSAALSNPVGPMSAATPQSGGSVLSANGGARECRELGNESAVQRFRGYPTASGLLPLHAVAGCDNILRFVSSTSNSRGKQPEPEQRSGYGSTVPDLAVAEPDQRAGRCRQHHHHDFEYKQSAFDHKRVECPLVEWNRCHRSSVRIAGELQPPTSCRRAGKSSSYKHAADCYVNWNCHGGFAPEYSRAPSSGSTRGARDLPQFAACLPARHSRFPDEPRFLDGRARRPPPPLAGHWRRAELGWRVSSGLGLPRGASQEEWGDGLAGDLAAPGVA